MRPEGRLLLYCSRTQRTFEIDEHIRTLVARGLDWPFVVQQAQQHRVTTLMYASLRAVVPASTPQAVLSELHTLSMQSARRSLYLAGELVRLLRLFDERGIPAVAYKGPVLAVQAYGNVTLREFGDLDILIRRSDFARASDVLVVEGYQSYDELTAAKQPHSFQTDHDCRFLRPADTVFVELQWAISQRLFPFPLGYEDVKDRFGHVKIGGVSLSSIAVEQQLLLLCVHGAKHAWERLLWVCDIAEILRRHPSIDWPRLFADASRLGAGRMLALGLLLATTLLDAELPPPVRQRVQADPEARRLAEGVSTRLFNPEATFAKVLGHRRLYFLGLMNRLPDRVRLLLHLYRRTVLPLPAIRQYGVSALRRLLGR